MARSQLVVVAVLLATVLSPRPAAAQGVDDFFNRQALQDVYLQVNSTDLANMHADFTADTYYPADLTWGSVTVRNIGIRNRGGGSRNNAKLGIRVEFDHYSTGQRFLGLQTLILNNAWQDPSMLHESVTMTFLRRMGQPAPRVSFARLYINKVYAGVYVLEEAIDPLFLQRTLGESSGYLFEDIYGSPYYATDLGDDLAPYKTLFEIKDPHKADSDALLYVPIRNLFREANQDPPETWRDRVGQFLDLDQFVTHVALENFVAEFDGVLGYAGMNNFYIYRSTATSPHRLIAKDKSFTFYSSDFPIFNNADQNVLMRNALLVGDLKREYLDVLLQSAASIEQPDATGAMNWLEREITDEAALIRDAAYLDTLKDFSNDEFEQEVDKMEQFARVRGPFVAAEVAKATGSSSTSVALVDPSGQETAVSRHRSLPRSLTWAFAR